MFKKSKTGLLIGLLIVLMGVYFVVRYSDSSDRSFKDVILTYDPEDITEVYISNPADGSTIHLKIKNDAWRVIKEDKNYPADTTVVKNILVQLSSLGTKRYAGKGDNIWRKYEVTDTTAITVSLVKGSKQIAEVLIGKFSYNVPPQAQQQQAYGRQPQGEMTTYVRLSGEDEVYAVDGFLKMNFNRGEDTYREKIISRMSSGDIMQVKLNGPNENFTLSKNDGIWMIGDEMTDSTKAARYVSSISRLSGSAFYDDRLTGSNAIYTAEITGNNFAPVMIEAFAIADTNVNYAIRSSMNKESVFNGKQSDLFTKIFVSSSSFFNEAE